MGMYSAGAGTVCANCSAGTFSSSTGAVGVGSCTDCPAGKYSSDVVPTKATCLNTACDHGSAYSAAGVSAYSAVEQTASLAGLDPGMFGVGDAVKTAWDKTFSAAVVSADGFVYGIPDRSKKVFKVDAFTARYDSSSVGQVQDLPGEGEGTVQRQGRFPGGTLAPNGKIYCVPGSASYILAIQPCSLAPGQTACTDTLLQVGG